MGIYIYKSVTQFTWSQFSEGFGAILVSKGYAKPICKRISKLTLIGKWFFKFLFAVALLMNYAERDWYEVYLDLVTSNF